MNWNVEAVIFDFDGLILDTETPGVQAWRWLFESYGCVFPDSWWIENTGRGAEQIIVTPYDLLEEQLGHPIDLNEVRKTRYDKIQELLLKEPARPGVEERLDEAEALGLRIGIASSSKHAWVDPFLERLGLTHRFETVRCADDVERAKPYPELYLAACDCLNVEPQKAIALEDSPNGITAAKAAGMYCIAVPNPVTAALDLSQADLRFESLSDFSFRQLIEAGERTVKTP